MTTFIDVIIPRPIHTTFTYRVPAKLTQRIQMGVRVLVPFGATQVLTALVVRLHSTPPDMETDKVKEVLDVLDPSPVVLPAQLRLWQWVATYYLCTLGDVFTAALPAGLKAENGWRPKMERYVELPKEKRNAQALLQTLNSLVRSPKQHALLTTYLSLSHWDQVVDHRLEEATDEMPEEIREVTAEELLNVTHATSAILRQLTRKYILNTYDKEVGRLPKVGVPQPERAKELSEAQRHALHQVQQQWEQHAVVLLHGVTASGKTEIYIHLIAQALAEGKQVLYLLPEIALTVQMMQRLQRVFGHRLGIYHSKYSDAERMEVWRKQLSDQPYDVVLGVRSAVFLPFQRLGLIIVDEEHEQSYKQQEPAPRYHARSVATVLAQMSGAKTLVGSATPSLETWYLAHSGKWGLVQLLTRHRGLSLPRVEVADVKDLQRRRMMTGPLSPQLTQRMEQALASGQQALLFQNRRGFAPVVMCRSCGWVPKCQNCDVSLTYHKRQNALTCHICGFTTTVPSHCPKCDSPAVSDKGWGTEKIEEELATRFPNARVARMDLDTTRTRQAQERIINDFAHGRTDILVGTQMVTKGLDFERVAVVGILDADAILSVPDFRAWEHAFSMMNQVAGRAGRHGSEGTVVLQTRQTDLPLIEQVVQHRQEEFYHDALEDRQAFSNPPFCRLIYVYLRHKHEAVVETASQVMAARLRNALAHRVLGPGKPPVAKMRQLFIRKIDLKLELNMDLTKLRQLLWETRMNILKIKDYATVEIYFDVDPL